MSRLDIGGPHPADIEGRGLDDSRAGHRSLGPNPHRGRLNSDTPSFNPQRTDRSVARTVGLSPTTVAEVREETLHAEGYVQTGHSEPTRVEDSGKKPRGRKPKSELKEIAAKLLRDIAGERSGRASLQRQWVCHWRILA